MRNLLYLLLFCAACEVVSGACGKGCLALLKKLILEKLKKCGDGEVNLVEAFKGSTECWGEFHNPEPSGTEEQWDGDKEGTVAKYNNKMCFWVCKWKKNGMLDDSGSFSESGTGEFIDRIYPEEFRANIAAEVTICASDHSSKFSMDNNCAGYTAFKKCIDKAHWRVCGIKIK